jgi:hypothetical protein
MAVLTDDPVWPWVALRVKRLAQLVKDVAAVAELKACINYIYNILMEFTLHTLCGSSRPWSSKRKVGQDTRTHTGSERDYTLQACQ